MAVPQALMADWRPTIRLTATMRSGKYILEIDGIKVALSYTHAHAFFDLVHARLTTAAGHTTLPSIAKDDDVQLVQMTIYRLRVVLTDALGERFGQRLIRNARGRHYYLDLPPEDITIDASFPEIANIHFRRHDFDDLNRAVAYPEISNIESRRLSNR